MTKAKAVPFRSVHTVPIQRVRHGHRQAVEDVLAVEEPLEVRVSHGPRSDRRTTSLGLTMRTPGHDRELVAGLLYAEGYVTKRAQLVDVRPAVDADGAPQANEVVADLSPGTPFHPEEARKAYLTSSACGVCGRANLDALESRSLPKLLPRRPRVKAAILGSLPTKLREAQLVFEATGALHAAALFDVKGNLHALREDVGRHNAVDKLLGAEFWADRLPLADAVLLVSGRAGYEILQKARAAGIGFVASVGAPTSLAVELAQRFGVTLVGFLKESGHNVYSHASRCAP